MRKKRYILIILILAILLVSLSLGYTSIAKLSRKEQISPVPQKPRNLNQSWNNRPHCDLNWDNRCDQQDFQLFQQALGKCEPDYKTAIDVESDIDVDGCVTSKDQYYLFPDIHE